MGELYDKAHIKNIGAIIAFMTFLWGAWYTLVRFHYIVLDGSEELLLRAVGIFLITFLAYLPYSFAFRVFEKIPCKPLFLGFMSVFFIIDVVLRTLLFFGDLSRWGFFFALAYPVFMALVTYAVFLSIYIIRCIIIEQRAVVRFWSSTKKSIVTMLHK